MSVFHRARMRPERGHSPVVRWGALAATLTLSAGLAGCTGTNADETDTPVVHNDSTSSASPSATPTPESAATISANLPDSGTVSVGRTVELTATDGTFDSVEVTFGKRGRELAGTVSDDQTTWNCRSGLIRPIRTVFHACRFSGSM